MTKNRDQNIGGVDMTLGTEGNGGEADVKNKCRDGQQSVGSGRWRAAATLVVSIIAMLWVATGDSDAQQRLALTNSAHTATVTVLVGKSEDVHIDQALVDITVGDPEIADVNPLTDHALSILGKKIGTTRVTVYGEGKRAIGILTSRCPTTCRDSALKSPASSAAAYGCPR